MYNKDKPVSFGDDEMLCENCGKREATTHIKRLENGEAIECHLCSECARSLGYDDIFGDFGLGELFSNFFGDSSMRLAEKVDRCEKCGSSWGDIVRTGRVGCADCYRRFYDKLLPSIERIHGRVNHSGRAPVNTKKKKEPSREKVIEKLNFEMENAVKEQNFEEAAKIRDRIKLLKEGE